MALEIITARWPTGEKITIEVSWQDCAKIHRGCPWVATVTDQKTGIVYTLRGTPASIGDIVVVSAWNPDACAQG